MKLIRRTYDIQTYKKGPEPTCKILEAYIVPIGKIIAVHWDSMVELVYITYLVEN